MAKKKESFTLSLDNGETSHDPTWTAPATSHQDSPQPEATGSSDPDAVKGKKRKRKVNHACLYCRRSHMTCDDNRPCARCVKREIGHLCHDEHTGKPGFGQRRGTEMSPPANTGAMGIDPTRTLAGGLHSAVPAVPPPPIASWPLSAGPSPFMYESETLGNEFSVLSDFLESLDERSFFNPPNASGSSFVAPIPFNANQQPQQAPGMGHSYTPNAEVSDPPPPPPAHPHEEPIPNILPAATKTEQFLLTAADQEPGSRDERLNRVIRSKFEAGLLKPYNYVKGYARLSRWMDRNVSQESKQQILQPLSVLRPNFRAVAQSLTDMELVLIEESFERLLLDYDRVFSAMAIPACLWRRTGEIYKGNREFAELVGMDGYMLREGRLCIYELMAEESAVNYWQKYGQIAFDSTQKAILTSCVLRYKPHINTAAPAANASASGSNSPTLYRGNTRRPPNEEGFTHCTFSFTIRRDAWGIPSMIVGNFIKC